MERFKEIMREVPSSVVIITTMWRGEPVGMTVNTFNSVSLDPLLVMFMADRRKGNEVPYIESRKFCVNFVDNRDLLKIFAFKNVKERFSTVKYRLIIGVPILEESFAYMISEVKSVYEEGDHSIIIGKIVDMEMKRNATPIIYFKKKFLSIPKGLGV
jgi:Conserved protein/domain typically associated with flavoprotein oxygenases, DIM6/NTAB family